MRADSQQYYFTLRWISWKWNFNLQLRGSDKNNQLNFDFAKNRSSTSRHDYGLFDAIQ